MKRYSGIVVICLLLWWFADIVQAKGPSRPAPDECRANSGKTMPAPVYGYEVVAAFPHDPQAFTQGLVFENDCFFDYIVAKNSFEHIIGLEKMLEEMKKRLKPGGNIYTGFGPLYNSPNGPHMEKIIIPWGHLIFPDVIFSKISQLSI